MLDVFNASDINTKVPIKMWINWNERWSYPQDIPATKENAIHYMGIEESAKEQILHLANLPFAFHHIAIMPDCHTGYGMPIGGVLVTEGVVIPNAVGVDVGCGMCAVKTSLKSEQLTKETLKKIMGKIREVIPLGFEHHKEKQSWALMPKCGERTFLPMEFVVNKEFQNALTQIGTLGGGNHFIEIQKDTADNIWIMIHSGSRNLGYKVAEYYNEIAYDLDVEWHSNTYLPKNNKDSLAFLPIEDPRAKNYMTEMQYCVDFALANRKLMMERVKEQLYRIVTEIKDKYCEFLTSHKKYIEMFPNDMINIAHNYARWENHFGKNVIVHRKGATSARKDEMGIIPGSQGSKSYIVRGLGNPESFTSCSHGAGRKMGRKEAERTLNLQEEIKKLDDQGIIHGIRSAKNLDEAAGAYKDIDEVMRNQADLVEIVTELNPLAVIKGD